MRFDRESLLSDRSLTGSKWCEAYSRLVDEWLAALYDAAGPPASGVALVAIGGYGRGELCPASDIDVMLVRDKRVDVRAVAERLWYPIWDEGLKLGHSVSTVRDALQLAASDLDTATALLSARRLAGDAALAAALGTEARRQWTDKGGRWLKALADRVDERHTTAGEVAFRLEPDLKEGRGGMRDVHALQWAEAAHRVLLHHDEAAIDAAYHVLLDARVELHRHTGRATNVLTLHDQAAVADALGDASTDDLMLRVAAAARVIAWTSDDAWRRVRSGLAGPRARTAGAGKPVGAGVWLVDGEIHLEPDAEHTDADAVLRVAVAAAEHAAAVERTTLQRLSTVPPPIEPWGATTQALFVTLLRAGRSAVPVIEALDHHGSWETLVPEWSTVRARPQHNPYHRFTVDRHLLETVAHAAALAERVDRPDLLVLAALFHDLGKGDAGDHTEAGVAITTKVGHRMGLADADVDEVASLVAHHLLLGDVATRRDLDDPATTSRVVGAVQTLPRLRLLAALTEADAKATGPLAWTAWRAELVGALVARVARALGDTDVDVAADAAEFPTSDDLARLAEPGQHIDVGDGTVTVITDDRPGVFSKVAGVLALRGLDVVQAAAHSEGGRAMNRFTIHDPVRDDTPWDRVVRDLELALSGRLALRARLAERVVSYARGRPAAGTTAPASVTFDNAASATATVIDVEAPDATGVLYAITSALADLDLDIRSAKIQTLGTHVVDAFYVCDRAGEKITEPGLLGEIERAIVHEVAAVRRTDR